MNKTSKKLIILNGFAASGKTTIAKKYIAQHPLSLCIEGDEIIAMIGQWLKYEEKARDCIFALTKMSNETAKRRPITIQPIINNIDDTYTKFLEAIGEE